MKLIYLRHPCMSIMLMLLLTLVFSVCSLGQQTATTSTPTLQLPEPTSATLLIPIDWRHQLKAEEFVRTDQGYWLSPQVTAPFPFDELIYSWSVHLPAGQGFRLYVQVGFDETEQSPWLYAGFWGKVKLIEERSKITFDQGVLDQDQIFLKKKAKSFRFRVESEGEAPLTVLLSLHVIVTDNHPSAELAQQFTPPAPETIPAACILDIPLRRQEDSQGNDLKNHCQSAALASAMQYFGKTVNLEDISAFVHDPEYNLFGIWPRTIQTAIEFGFEAYIDRFRNWVEVRNALAQNKVILCSITMPKDDFYLAPPYPSMSGHIVALNGITEDGRVVVTDSTRYLIRRGGGYRVQWLMQDFEKIWMQNKGAVGMVICPPPNAVPRLVHDLPPFPLRTRTTPAER